jgi:hypothetical protein
MLAQLSILVATRRNWTAAAGLLLGLGAVLSYFTLVTTILGPRFPWLRNVPLLNFALLAAALWLSWRGVRAGRWPARVGAVTNLALAGLFAFYVFGLSSMLPDAPGAPRVGQAAPEFSLVSHRGETVTLGELKGAPVVLVFYRGFW